MRAIEEAPCLVCQRPAFFCTREEAAAQIEALAAIKRAIEEVA
jgi:hypothetical protein